MKHDPILAADYAEEQAAAEALRKAASQDELVSAWWLEAEHFEGAARERLQDVYRDTLRRVSVARAG